MILDWRKPLTTVAVRWEACLVAIALQAALGPQRTRPQRPAEQALGRDNGPARDDSIGERGGAK
jgi:hypothetical protein